MRKSRRQVARKLEPKTLEEKLEHIKENVGNKIDPKLATKLVREDRDTH